MFEQYAYTEKADSNSLSSDDDEPPPSPKSESSKHSSPTLATKTLRPSDRRVESLIQRMNNQELMRSWWAAVSSEPQSQEANDVSMQMQVSPTNYLVESDPTANRLSPPIIENGPVQLQPQQEDEAIRTEPEQLPSADAIMNIIDNDKSWRRPETCPSHDLSHNSGKDLITNMIENGEQCNVQVSIPPDPIPAPEPSSIIEPPIQHTNNINPQLLYPGSMALEVNMNYCAENDDESLPSEKFALRNAGVPSGIRKFGYLKYRSSVEAAARCKNMKRCIPRVRKRPKPTVQPDATTASATTASTSTASTSTVPTT